MYQELLANSHDYKCEAISYEKAGKMILAQGSEILHHVTPVLNDSKRYYYHFRKRKLGEWIFIIYSTITLLYMVPPMFFCSFSSGTFDDMEHGYPLVALLLQTGFYLT